MFRKNKKQEKIQEKTNIDVFAEKLEQLKREYNVDFQISLSFPEFNILPADIQLAMLVINKHRVGFNIKFIDTNGKN